MINGDFDPKVQTNTFWALICKNKLTFNHKLKAFEAVNLQTGKDQLKELKLPAPLQG